MLRDPRDDPVAAARAVENLRRDHAPQLQPPVGRSHPGGAAGDLHGAEERMYAALEHLVDDARPAIGRIARDLHRTRSPCITPRICGGGRNTLSLKPSTRRKP